ncbi:protein of unknown function DUF2154 [Alkalithermobacter thermoalcaliphilus JW-YL-7 = DSM 7308]|nr:protein of unknown function DUF2154 [[Clostridium] paradoxum JW-YL-7 = DSM 7308]
MNLVGNENIVLGKQIDTETANLDLKLKASDLNIKSTEDDLIKVYAPKQRLEYNVDFSDKKAFVSFFEKEELDIYNKIQQKDYDFYLNKDILWNIDAKIGVVNSTVDISNLKIKRLNIDSGAGNLKIILGDKNDISDINVKMGAGNVEIIIPDNLGVKIDTKGLIKDINFPNSDWEKIDNYYLSPNYKEFDKKVNLEIVMGAGNIKVYQR